MSNLPRLTVMTTPDFDLTGDGRSSHWNRATWHTVPSVWDGGSYQTRFKILYSSTGLYVLFDCEDKQLTCSGLKDFDDLFNEDVVEAFFMPYDANDKQDVYFEYEVSPLGKELILLMANHDGSYKGWLPWHYEEDRLCRRATSVRGGPKQSMAKVEGWSAEFFTPYALMKGLGNLPPTPGMKWKANFYRIDYDNNQASHYSWSPISPGTFHKPKEFGTIVFE
jgi:hypothetical protein